MADASLVVAVVGAPHGHEFAVQVGCLVGELRGSTPEHAVRPGLRPDLQDLVANLADGLIPADARPMAVDELGWIFEAALAGGQLPRGRAFGAMRAHVDDALEHGLLAAPDAVLHLGPNAAADRAKWTDGLDALCVGCAGRGGLGLRLPYAAAHERDHACQTGRRRQAGRTQEPPAG